VGAVELGGDAAVEVGVALAAASKKEREREKGRLAQVARRKREKQVSPYHLCSSSSCDCFFFSILTICSTKKCASEYTEMNCFLLPLFLNKAQGEVYIPLARMNLGITNRCIWSKWGIN
jgi:hypothetical protein